MQSHPREPPALFQKLLAATTPSERANILKEYNNSSLTVGTPLRKIAGSNEEAWMDQFVSLVNKGNLQGIHRLLRDVLVRSTPDSSGFHVHHA